MYSICATTFGNVCHPHTQRYISSVTCNFRRLTVRTPGRSSFSLFSAMATQQTLPEVQNVQFRILVIGKANAGKTSILQRVCDTTDSPVIYSVDSSGARKQVRFRYYWRFQFHRQARFNSTLQWRLVRLISYFVRDADVRTRHVQRGEHNIAHELIFSSHNGYVFHDSRGFEGGSEDELKAVQNFVRQRSRERLLKSRLHAIWFVPLHLQPQVHRGLHFRYCVPMDCARPSLELKHFEDICPDKNGAFKHNFVN